MLCRPFFRPDWMSVLLLRQEQNEDKEKGKFCVRSLETCGG